MRTPQTILVSLLCLATSTVAEEAIDPGRAANTIILDEMGVKNLRIEIEPVEEQAFETTVFAIGRLEETPDSRSAVSSRISANNRFKSATVTRLKQYWYRCGLSLVIIASI